MELVEAINKAGQILDEERLRPTAGYSPVSPAVTEPRLETSTAWRVLQTLGRAGDAQQLSYERHKRPRPVHENPDTFRFQSVNYDLLLALYSQVEAGDRPAFIAALLSRISASSSARELGTISVNFPSWNSCVSELPLLGEFCIRVGFKVELSRSIGESQLTAGLVLLLMQLEETIALNFNLFSDAELEQLGSALSNLRTRTVRKTERFIGPARPHGQPRPRNPEYSARVATYAGEIAQICNGIIQQCKQARYWYLKGALQQNANLEVNFDKTRVEGFLRNLNFSGPLLEALNAADQYFRDSATPFELKNSLAHLRSFLEGLHEQACRPLAATGGNPLPKKWGKTTEMLRNTGVLSRQEEVFVTSLYTLISDEGVHPLIAEREYARLLRNVVIEYGLMFLTKLEKAGLRHS